MAAAPRPYFRTPLYPAPDNWSGGPGASYSIVVRALGALVRRG